MKSCEYATAVAGGVVGGFVGGVLTSTLVGAVILVVFCRRTRSAHVSTEVITD